MLVPEHRANVCLRDTPYFGGTASSVNYERASGRCRTSLLTDGEA
jgi:hypothetical protein